MNLPYAGTWKTSQRFGSNKAAYAKWGMEGHNGYDVACNTGTPLLACVSGVVTERQNDPTGYGQYAVITDDGGGQWLYGHASLWTVVAGERVEEGQQIGRSGNTGNSTGPHLHFAYRPAGYDRSNGYLGYVNPRPFLPIPYRVLLQAGHYPNGGGAPGEAGWTWLLAKALEAKLAAAGIESVTIGDFYGKAPSPAQAAMLSQDYDLALFLHYDAAIYKENSGCLIARGDFETEPWEADRFVAEWKRTYPAATGIPLRQERVNPNLTRYYALAHLTYVTPGIVLEHGVGAPGVGLDAPVLWDDMERVVEADAAAVLATLTVASPGEDAEMQGIIDELNKQVTDLRAEIDGLHGLATERESQIAALRAEMAGKDSTIGALTEHVIKPLELRVAVMESQLRDAIAAAVAAVEKPKRVEVELGDGQRIGFVREAA